MKKIIEWTGRFIDGDTAFKALVGGSKAAAWEAGNHAGAAIEGVQAVYLLAVGVGKTIQRNKEAKAEAALQAAQAPDGGELHDVLTPMQPKPSAKNAKKKKRGRRK